LQSVNLWTGQVANLTIFGLVNTLTANFFYTKPNPINYWKCSEV